MDALVDKNHSMGIHSTNLHKEHLTDSHVKITKCKSRLALTF